MKNLMIIAVVSLFIGGCGMRAGTKCTDAPKSQWQDENAFQENLISQGYEIDKFLVTGGNCYEIYGKNPAGEKTEVYFNPVSGEIVKAETR